MNSTDLASFVNFFFTVLTIIVFGRALLSWFDPGMKSAIGQLLFKITEPLLAPIRRIMPTMGAIDLSPIILLIGLQFLRTVLVSAIQ
ncbi:YggT family protein [soil metagenome]